MALFTFGHTVLPYCLEKLPNGKWAALNREYKPVGFCTRERIEYNDHPIGMPLKGLTAALVGKAAVSGSLDEGRFYLYNDACVPTHDPASLAAYLERLSLLMHLELDVEAV